VEMFALLKVDNTCHFVFRLLSSISVNGLLCIDHEDTELLIFES